MKILIDINHPAHVHYFRNFIKLMEAKGHQFCVINRDSKMINQLLDFYGIDHIIRNKRPKKRGTIVSLTNLLTMTIWCVRESLKFHPDIYIGFASSACAITSKIFRKPSILIDDTEHNTMNHKIYMPLCSVVLTPFYFRKNLDNRRERGKQLRFNAYVEQLYLHSKQYINNESVLNELNVKPKQYVIIRYVAYNAHHDIGVHPISGTIKKEIVKKIANHFRVLISLEEGVSDPFYEDYILAITPEKMHDLEAKTLFMVTEGATMASESFVHGVPYLYINPLRCGNIDYQCENNPDRAFQTTDGDKALKIIEHLIKTCIETEAEKRKVEEQTVNPTLFLEWFVENYPNSKLIMQENPNYQYKFR